MSTRQNPSARMTGRPRDTIGAVAIAITTLAITACTDDSDGSVEARTVEPTVSITGPPASAATTATATPRTPDRELAVGQISGAPWTSVRYAVPPGWEVDEMLVRALSDEPHNVAVRFLDVANIFTDPCQWTRFDPPVGPTVDDLVSALQQVPSFDVTTPRDVTVDGFDGKYVEFTFDGYDEAVCRDGRFSLWVQTGDSNPDGPGWWAQGPEQTTRVWILDVAGSRLVIEGFYHPETPAQHRAAIDEIVNSVQIG